MFYFGLDENGLISTHIFDRKISNLRPSPLPNTAMYPWLRNAPQWSSDLLVGVGSFGIGSDSNPICREFLDESEGVVEKEPSSGDDGFINFFSLK